MRDRTSKTTGRPHVTGRGPGSARRLVLAALGAASVLLAITACEQSVAPPPSQPPTQPATEPPTQPPVAVEPGLLPGTEGFAAAVGTWRWKFVPLDVSKEVVGEPGTALVMGFRFVDTAPVSGEPASVPVAFTGTGWNGDLPLDGVTLANPDGTYPEDVWTFVLADTPPPTGDLAGTADAVHSVDGQPVNTRYTSTIAAAGTPLDPVASVDVSDVSDTAVTISWTPLPEAAAYYVQLSAGTSYLRTLAAGESTTTFTLDAPLTDPYLVTVEAFSSDIVLGTDATTKVDPAPAGFNASSTSRVFAPPTPVP